MWKPEWKTDDPVFTVDFNTRQTILHSIHNLDPHHPVFKLDECTQWCFWPSIVFKRKEDGCQTFIKTPWVRGGNPRLSKNLKTLLMFHCYGEIPRPLTSSQKPCPCESGLSYGVCCFPCVISECENDLCVNPLHLKLTSAKHVKEHNQPILDRCNHVCRECGFSTQEFQVAKNVFGVTLESEKVQVEKIEEKVLKCIKEYNKTKGNIHERKQCQKYLLSHPLLRSE